MKKKVANRISSGHPKPRWGTDTGVDGKENCRLVQLNQLTNYQRLTHKGFNFYVALIDGMHPRFIRNSKRGKCHFTAQFLCNFFCNFL